MPSRSYNFTTNSWILAFTAAEIIWGAADKHRSANVTSGFCCHTAHAVFFPFPYRADTVSQPVMLWKAGRAPARASPSWLAISCAGMYLKFFPVPNAIQGSLSSCRCLITEMAITTTSLSVVRNATFVNPLKVWSATCTNIRVSASACVHGETEARFSRGRLLTTSGPSVDMICLPSGTLRCSISFDIRANNSVLLASTRKNPAKFPGTLVWRVPPRVPPGAYSAELRLRTKR